MNSDKLKALLEKYYKGETSLEEECELRAALKTDEELSKDIQADAELFTMMSALSSDSIDTNPDIEAMENKVVSIDRRSEGYDLRWTMRIAAGLSLIVFGVFAGWILGTREAESNDIAALRQDLNEMKHLVALSRLRKESPSERIMATYEFKKLDSASDEVLDALINSFHNDDNTNVRNAAAEALFKFGNQDKVRKAFINGLSNQADPVLQIKLIEMLVILDEKRALPKFQEMIREESQMKVVKQKAAQGIGKLL